MDQATELVRRHVRLFNDGVRSGDFGPMLEQFTEDAELVFEGVPVGPFRTKDEIAAAYAERPPDDEITIGEIREVAGALVTDYRWNAEPDTRAGELRITSADGRIARLVITFDRAVA